MTALKLPNDIKLIIVKYLFNLKKWPGNTVQKNMKYMCDIMMIFTAPGDKRIRPELTRLFDNIMYSTFADIIVNELKCNPIANDIIGIIIKKVRFIYRFYVNPRSKTNICIYEIIKFPDRINIKFLVRSPGVVEKFQLKFIVYTKIIGYTYFSINVTDEYSRVIYNYMNDPEESINYNKILKDANHIIQECLVWSGNLNSRDNLGE